MCSSDAEVRSFVVKNLRFFLNYGVSAWTGGKGINFWRFYANVFYDQTLIQKSLLFK